MELCQLLLCIHLQMQSLVLALSPPSWRLVGHTPADSTEAPPPPPVAAVGEYACRFQRTDVAHCASQLHVSRIPDETLSYGFGFGSVNDAEAMCKTKWHLHVQTCIGERVLQRCYEHGASEFQISMWRFIFDSRPHERAAIYLCKPHNMKIFRTHREHCFKPHEASASLCTQRQSRDLARATAILASQTEDISHDPSTDGSGGYGSATRASSAAEYVAYIQEQISAAHCETTLEKIRCLTSVLQRNCSMNAVKLIQNYFREMLPRHCYYTSEFETEKGGSRGSQVEAEVSPVPLKNPDPIHLLNDANHDDTPVVILKGTGHRRLSAGLFLTPIFFLFLSTQAL